MKAAAPTRKVLSQYGYRINETGRTFWGVLDLRYSGANSTSRADVIEHAEAAIAQAKRLGVELTFTVLRRDHLTTTWSRLLPVVEEK